MSDPDVIVELIEKLRNPDDHGEKSSFLLREEAMNRLVHLGDVAVPYLIPLLRDGNTAVREHAARALGYIGHLSALPALIDAVEDVYIRGASIRALEGMGKAAVPALIDLAAHHDGSIRVPALSILSSLGGLALPALREVLMDGGAPPRKREAAGYAMSIIRKDRKCPFGGNRTMGRDCKYCERKHT